MGHFLLQSYEKIRVVGKGAFGNAVLYRRRADGLMCIIKVILSIVSRDGFLNMHGWVLLYNGWLD